MRASKKHVDRPLALLLVMLVAGGALIFASAAFGLLARGNGGMSSVFFSHLVLGIGVGLVGLFITATVDYRVWRRFAPYLFGLAILLTSLVFVPHIGAMHGGGRRWIVLFGMSFQPSETLKLCGVIMAAAYFAAIRSKITTLRYGVGGFFAILAIPALILVAQPDLGTFGVVAVGVFAVYWIAGARVRDIALITVVMLLVLGVIAFAKPYARQRIVTFLDPSQGSQTQGYQIRQSLIAVGSGGFLGHGFGQGLQKFTYLPEPMGDSIFAVAGEELGFVGAVAIIITFLLFALRGLSIATHAIDPFGACMAAGISTYLVVEAFINIASMLGVAPLTGIPLTFVSQGGSAMLVSLTSAGVLLNISRFQRSTPAV